MNVLGAINKLNKEYLIKEHWATMTVNLITKIVTKWLRVGNIYSVDSQDKVVIHILGSTGQDFIMLLRTACDLKLINCLPLELSI